MTNDRADGWRWIAAVLKDPRLASELMSSPASDHTSAENGLRVRTRELVLRDVDRARAKPAPTPRP